MHQPQTQRRNVAHANPKPEELGDGLASDRRQRKPLGTAAFMVGLATGTGSAVGGVVVVVTVTPVDMPPPASVATVPVPVPVPVCSSSNATASTAITTMALAAISADSSLTIFCWLGSTLTTPIPLGWFPDPSARHPWEMGPQRWYAY